MAKLDSAKRNKLDDSDFGIPEKRMYPLNDKAHVEAAAKMFGHASNTDKPNLAKRILSRAQDLGIDTAGWTQVRTWANKNSSDDKKNNKRKLVKSMTLKESFVYRPEVWFYEQQEEQLIYTDFIQEADNGEQSGFRKFLEGVKKLWIKFIEGVINLWSKITDFFHGIKVKKLLKTIEEHDTSNGNLAFEYKSSNEDKKDAYNFFYDIKKFNGTNMDDTMIGGLIRLVNQIDTVLKGDDIYQCMEYFSDTKFKEAVDIVKSLFSKANRSDMSGKVVIKKENLISFVKYVSEHSDLSAIRRMRYRVRKLKKAAEDKGYVGKDVKKFAKDLRADGALLIKCMQNYQSSMVYAYKEMITTYTAIDTETIKEVNVTYKWFHNFCNRARTNGCESVVLFDNHMNSTSEFSGRVDIDYVLAITNEDGSTEAIGLKNTGPKDPELTKLIGDSGMVKIDVKKAGLPKEADKLKSTDKPKSEKPKEEAPSGNNNDTQTKESDTDKWLREKDPRLRNYLQMWLYGDPTLVQNQLGKKIDKSDCDWLFEPHEEMRPELPRDEWNEEYWELLMLDLQKNFSKRRFDLVRKVAAVVKKNNITEVSKKAKEEAPKSKGEKKPGTTQEELKKREKQFLIELNNMQQDLEDQMKRVYGVTTLNLEDAHKLGIPKSLVGTVEDLDKFEEAIERIDAGNGTEEDIEIMKKVTDEFKKFQIWIKKQPNLDSKKSKVTEQPKEKN